MKNVIKEFLSNKSSRNGSSLAALVAVIAMGNPWLS